jgi:hypothetical protein
MVCAVALFCALLGAAQGDDQEPPAATASDRAAYETAALAAGKDADAQVRLALWCEAHGMPAERRKHLGLAVNYNPSHALARALLGQVGYQSEWKSPDQLTNELADDGARKARVDEYLERRAKTSDRAVDQWKLAMWCEKNGLDQQAAAHSYQVLQHDPTRDAAWKHLGYKRIGGRWDKPERVAAAKASAELQHRASKHWHPLLEKWRSALSSRDKSRRADAEKGLAAVGDPRAVPSIWAVFMLGGASSQRIGVKLLGQIDAPGSARALALVALMSQSADVKRAALDILRTRDPRDYAGVLIALLRDPLKYNVKSVNGPGSQGELLIKSKNGNVKRVYTPLVAPSIPLLPNDAIALDADGLPVIVRYLGQWSTGMVSLGTKDMNAAAALLGFNTPESIARSAAMFNQLGAPTAATQHFVANASSNKVPVMPGSIPGRDIYVNETFSRQIDIPIGQMMRDTQVSAQIAAQQLAGDVQAIEAYNAPIIETNERIQSVLSDATGTNLSPDRTAWEKWLVDLMGYAYSPERSYSQQPTVVEQVPISYQPQATPVVVDQRTEVAVFQHSCFGAGTPVRTMDGLRPIETLLAGDQVLTADSTTGALRYQPVLAVYHNPPASTFRVQLGHESIVATGIHRLWKAGKGWVMTRDLKPGDTLRTAGGVAIVKSVDKERVQPVFNLHVAEGESFFVGQSGVLAHDNSLVNPTPNPFDSIADLAHLSVQPAARPAAGADSK